MKLAVYSDIHLELNNDRGARDRRLLSLLVRLPNDLDVLVLAGDIDHFTRISHVLKMSSAFASHVIFVNGNHELYGCLNAQDAIHRMEDEIEKIRNVYYLNNNLVTIEGQKFLGGTMWFTPHPMDYVYRSQYNDFRAIPEFEKNLTLWNSKTLAFLDRELAPEDIVVTHHAPHPLCIAKEYATEQTNRFYYCNMDKLIEERKPQYWIHGHMHIPVHLQVADTWIESNPVGYPMDKQNLTKKVLDVRRDTKSGSDSHNPSDPQT